MTTVNAINPLDQQAKALANTKPIKADGFKLLADEKADVKAWALIDKEACEDGDKLVEKLKANGKTPENFVGFRESEDIPAVKFRDSITLAIVEGWKDPMALKLYHADTESLSIPQRALQKSYREMYQEKYYNLRKAFTKFYTESQAGKTAKSKPASLSVQMLRLLNEAIKKGGDNKDAYAGMVDDLKLLRSLAIFKVVKDPKK